MQFLEGRKEMEHWLEREIVYDNFWKEGRKWSRLEREIAQFMTMFGRKEGNGALAGMRNSPIYANVWKEGNGALAGTRNSPIYANVWKEGRKEMEHWLE